MFCFSQVGKVEPPNEGGFWELGEWHESTMESPWRYAENPKMAPFDQQVSLFSYSYQIINYQ